jgi:ABC-type glycerol-3-phosphate transport system substrate-binding protein
MKRILCALLALLMLLSLAACGTGDSGKSTESESATQSEETETEANVDTSLVCDLPSNLNYKDDEVTIIYAKASGREDELVSEGLGNGTVSDAVYERNQLVESQLHVKLNLIGEDGANVATKVKTDISTSNGTPEYDLVSNGTYVAITPAIEGQYKNLSVLDNIDTSKSYWTQGYNNLTTFTSEKRQYLASGPIAISMFRLMFLTIYNRTVMENNKMEDLYDVVMRGDWTLDYQYSLISGMYVDLSGDSKRTDDDAYGFITGNIVSVDPYMVSGGVALITKDPETMELTFNSDAQAQLTELVDAVQKLLQDSGTYMYSGSDMDDVGKSNIVDTFGKGNSLMATLMFWNMETNIDQLSALSYGIAPIPKYSTTQEYRSYVQDQVSSFGISAGVRGEDRTEELAAVLESMAYHSYNVVRPAYYTNTLSTRYMQDPQSEQILNLIFKSLYFDFSQTCSNILTGSCLRDLMRPIMSGKKNTVSSQMRSWNRSIPKRLTKINDSLDKLGETEE